MGVEDEDRTGGCVCRGEIRGLSRGLMEVNSGEL